MQRMANVSTILVTNCAVTKVSSVFCVRFEVIKDMEALIGHPDYWFCSSLSPSPSSATPHYPVLSITPVSHSFA